MNNLSLKLLRCLNKQNNNYGFTLIELLVVIIIIRILSAIASSSFLNIVRKAKEAEPTLKINGANKIQTNYYSENGEFSRDIADLELPDETKNYVYDVPDKIHSKSSISSPGLNPFNRKPLTSLLWSSPFKTSRNPALNDPQPISENSLSLFPHASPYRIKFGFIFFSSVAIC